MNVMCFRSCIVLSLALIVFAFFAGNAWSDNLSWTWTAPTTRVDGTAFDMATEGSGYYVWFNGVLMEDASGNPVLLTKDNNNITKVETGTTTVCIALATVDVDGRVGPDSVSKGAISCKEAKAPPGHPTEINVKIIFDPPPRTLP